ncbi:MAG: aminoacyl-tRNA hydrolase [Alicyclobacillaceae bacterium]|nr:aminoacyl-tRNA hydrolase [Alicyclobacillaceae bacterium]
MWIIAGLGNPGPAYEWTRHNIGFMVVERLVRRWNLHLSEKRFHSLVATGWAGRDKIVLLQPQTYMNESGRAIREALDWYKQTGDSLIVVYDDLDLPLGKVRLRAKGSSGGHNGIKSILQHLGSDRFGRVKIGIGRPSPGRSVVEHVLSPFLAEERPVVEEALEKAADLIEIAVREGFERAISKV